jgi:hypothetical protein
MQVQKTNGNITVCGQGNTHLEVFSELAELEEIFSSVGECGKCKSGNISFRMRKASDGKKKEYVYPEAQCRSCWAKFSFGQSEGGKLFPIKFLREDGEYLKDKDGKNIPKGVNGWVKYNKETGKEE